MGNPEFDHFMRLRNQLITVEKSGTAENLSTVLIPPMSEDIDEQLKLLHNMVDVVDLPYKKIL